MIFVEYAMATAFRCGLTGLATEATGIIIGLKARAHSGMQMAMNIQESSKMINQMAMELILLLMAQYIKGFGWTMPRKAKGLLVGLTIQVTRVPTRKGESMVTESMFGQREMCTRESGMKI